MEIKVDVSQITGIDLNTVVGDRLVYDHDADESIPHAVTLGDIVAEKLVQQLAREDGFREHRKKVMRIREEMIRKELEPIVAEAMNGPIQKTNQFGEAIGSTITLRELIMAEVNKVVNERRNASGYADNRAPTFLENLIKKEVGAAFVKEMKEVIDAEKGKIRETLRLHAASVLSKTIEDAASVIGSITPNTNE